LSVAKQENDTNKVKDELIGKQLGDYRLTSRLASGGMARVYKAMDYKLQRQAAVKVLEQDRVDGDKSLTKRFLREARAVAALEHDNIITLYQFGEESGVYFLAMKLIKGKDLSEELTRLRKSKTVMDVERAARIMTQVASALDYAHAAGIVHRDVKPSNILLDKDDKAILTDFGLVLRASVETTLGTAFGTPRYVAPEQAISSNKAVPQSDIYALGVILYEILTGQTPFNGDSPMEIALSQISDPPPPPRSINPNIPVEVEKELLKALEKEPEKRHKTAMKLVNAIKQGYGLPVTPDKTSPTVKIEIPQSALKKTQEIGVQTISVPISEEIPLKARQRANMPMMLMVLAAAFALVIAGIFIFNGLSGSGGGAATGAPVTLIYDENTFTMINGGDYPLESRKLLFVRGVENDRDDFSGDRIAGDVVPPGKCFQIVLQGSQASVPPQCQPISEHRHSQVALMEPLLFYWRAETQDSGKISTFEIRYDGEVITRCDTVARGQAGECRFNWPVTPTPVP
jgi:serine/threonine protein kinase